MRQMLRVLYAVIFVCVAQVADAQYYSWGSDRASISWSRIETQDVSVIFPDTALMNARRMLSYIDAVQPYENFGFKYPAMNLPFVVHADNFSSNGMVMWMPLRVEFLSTPAIDSYSMPWVKQLVAHEYRHAVQYNNLNRSTIKAFNYLLGQQGAAVSLLFAPLYALEGDAVMLETNMSTYGRGLQPSFTMGYRALADELLDRRNYMKWRCGSYIQDIPNHYNMGYQMMSYAYDRYGENILDRSFEYISRNPQFILPYNIALRKFYDTSTKELFYDTFSELIELWDEASDVENSAEIVTSGEKNNFITYSHPLSIIDGELLLLRSDYKEPSQFVLFNPETLEHSELAHTGAVSTRPSYAGGRVWWTEYRRSALFAQDVNSQLCYMDLSDGRPRAFKGAKNALYPTPIGDSARHIAYVEYDPSGRYSVVELGDDKVLKTIGIPFPNEVHAMAWDNTTERLYIIVTGDDGMWIEQQTEHGFAPITTPAYISLSNLTARDGKLYFGSIASGKDEVHSLDIASGTELQLSQSTYGSFQGSAVDSQLYMTTYDRFGYHLSRQDLDSSICQVSYSKVPKNQVNAEHRKWGVINLDTVKFDLQTEESSQDEKDAKKYRKGTHLFNLHSWTPFRFDPFNILSEMTLDVGLGATLISQNLLSSCEGFLAYGWDRYQGSVLNAGLNYDGLGVDLSLSATYGGEQNVYLLDPSQYDLKKYNSVGVSASLPLYFSRGYNYSWLQFYTGWSYSNGLVPTGLGVVEQFNPETGFMETGLYCDDIVTGLNKLSAGVSYSSYAMSASHDMTTPLGYSLSVSYALDPFNSDFSHLYSLYAKLFTPGLARNNSFTLAAAYQDSVGGFELDGYNPLSYVSSVLMPRGYSYLDVSNNNYFAARTEYKFPVSYPDFDMFNLVYFKRLALGFGLDYAQYQPYAALRESIYSYGVDFIVDLNAISLTSASTLSVTLSLYKPKDRNLYFQFGLDLPF
ncbi:MAG: hypothetical protein SNF93_03790 [Rikenellaceae bacterium]